MSYVPDHIQNAAFEGHMATVDTLRASLGRAPSHEETLFALAEAFGDMMGIFAGSGAQPHQIEAANRIAQRAFTNKLSMLRPNECEARDE